MRAQAKWVRMSARKGRIVAEHIRGRSVPEARAVLAFTQRAAARELEKVLASAVANAEANHGLVGDDLVVHAAVVDEGPTLKRWRARARGRVARIKKHTCHITPDARRARGRQSAAPPKRRQRRSRPRRAAAVVRRSPRARRVEEPRRSRRNKPKKPAKPLEAARRARKEAES